MSQGAFSAVLSDLRELASFFRNFPAESAALRRAIRFLEAIDQPLPGGEDADLLLADLLTTYGLAELQPGNAGRAQRLKEILISDRFVMAWRSLFAATSLEPEAAVPAVEPALHWLCPACRWTGTRAEKRMCPRCGSDIPFNSRIRFTRPTTPSLDPGTPGAA